MGWLEARDRTPRCRDVDVLDALLHGDGAAGCAVVVDDGAVVVVVVFSLKHISCLRKFAMFEKLFSTLVSGTKLSCTDDKRSKLSS